VSFFERIPETDLISVAAIIVSALLTGAVRRLALSQGILDLPNERSSHSKATPRGGGLAIVLTVTLGMVVLAATGELRPDLLVVLVVGGGAVALVGYIDDRQPLPPSVRLVVHVGAALWAAAWLGGLPALRIGPQTIHLGWAGYAVAALALVWTLNLFNFMDGIDGIAASEAVFVASCGALLSVTGASTSGVAVAALVVAAACAGFLLWNWPPAKIFMGDVGSGYLGYVIAVLALAATRDDPVTLWIWLILGGVFFVDATVTIVRRLVRGDRVHEAHRSHAYQWLARRWGSHRRVTVAVMMLNLIWLLPCAFLATLHPDQAVAIVVVALVPLVALAIAAGSGRHENANSETAIT
jgi:Fuc2NAc and GlcNAc transferase